MATLLIIDDDSTVRETLYDLFAATYECHTADRAEQALQYLEIEDYDVVLTDISMPGLGGFEVLRRMREAHAEIPVIVISGDVTDGDALLENGAFAYFAKPFLVEEVEDAVVRAIAKRRSTTGGCGAGSGEG